MNDRSENPCVNFLQVKVIVVLTYTHITSVDSSVLLCKSMKDNFCNNDAVNQHILCVYALYTSFVLSQ